MRKVTPRLPINITRCASSQEQHPPFRVPIRTARNSRQPGWQAIQDGLVVGPRVIAGCREIITTADSNDVTPWYWESHGFAGTRTADGPMSTPRRDCPRSRGTPITRIFLGTTLENDAVVGFM